MTATIDPLEGYQAAEIEALRRFTRNRWMFVFDRATEVARALAETAACGDPLPTETETALKQRINLIRRAGFSVWRDAQSLGMFRESMNPRYDSDTKLIDQRILAAVLTAVVDESGIMRPKHGHGYSFDDERVPAQPPPPPIDARVEPTNNPDDYGPGEDWDSVPY